MQIEGFTKTLETNKRIVKTVVMVAIFVFYAVFAWCYISRVGTILNLNSDTAAEVMFYLAAKEQGTIAPEGWMGGSMLHVNALLLYPATWLFGENYVLCWNVMSYSISMILFGSIVFYTRSVFHNNSWILIIPILFSTIFPQMTRLYLVYAEYSVGLILTLFFVSFYVRAVDLSGRISNKGCLAFSMILLFFACAIGTQGVQMITMPVVGASVLKIISERKAGDGFSKKRLCNYLMPVIRTITVVGGGKSGWSSAIQTYHPAAVWY